ncbi:MAG: S8 family serine peptidase [Candidatus Omnitrophica bacterium]|nr:S8 family serine peptidase [Candidatus Omnitrophota bacterium]
MRPLTLISIFPIIVSLQFGGLMLERHAEVNPNSILIFFPYLKGYESVLDISKTMYSAAAAYMGFESEGGFPGASVARSHNSPKRELHEPKNDGAIAAEDLSEFNRVAPDERSRDMVLGSASGRASSDSGKEDDVIMGSAPFNIEMTRPAKEMSISLAGGMKPSPTYIQAEDEYMQEQWGLDALTISDAWRYSTGGGVLVAVIDTGVYAAHPDLAANMWVNALEIPGNGVDDDGNGYIDDVQGWDFYNNDSNADDDHGHGTHVAGIIGALAGNGEGIAGIAPDCRILPLKVLDQTGSGGSEVVVALTRAIRYAVMTGAKVINMSIGLPPELFDAGSMANFLAAVGEAADAGVALVASAGNDNALISEYPALLDDVFVVGALAEGAGAAPVRASFSNYGSQLDFVAPGDEILSLRVSALGNNAPYLGDEDYTLKSGTSMSAPMVSGAIALLLAEDPLMSLDDIYRRLKYSAQDLGAAGYDAYYGNGLIDPAKALAEDYYEDGVIRSRKNSEPDALGIVLYEYDPAGQIVSARSVQGWAVAFEEWPASGLWKQAVFRDSESAIRKVIDFYADGATIQTETYYDDAGLPTTVHEYDPSGNPVRNVVKNPGPGPDFVTVMAYFSSGNLASVTYQSLEGAFLSRQEFLDENFYGNSRGRLRKIIRKDGTYDEMYYYLYGDSTARIIKRYNAAGEVTGRIKFDENGAWVSGDTDGLSFYENIADANTGMPLSHFGQSSGYLVTHLYDAALYILADGATSDQVMSHLMKNSPFVINSAYTPAGGLYIDLSTTGEWQPPSYDRWNTLVGPNAWAGLAALYQYSKTLNQDLLDFATGRANFIQLLTREDGGVLMGPAGQFGNYYNIRSTENNFSVLHFLDAMYAATGETVYRDRADAVWGYLKTMYAADSHVFLRGEYWDGVNWTRDSVDLYATDTTSWVSFDRVLSDPFFGATTADRLQELERMAAAAVSFAGVHDSGGEFAGFSFSPTARDLGVISIEWSSQMANFYFKLAKSHQDAGDSAAANAAMAKYQQLMDRLDGYFQLDADGYPVAPYAVTADGAGAYNVPTGHGFNTPGCTDSCTDVFSMASAYYLFARDGEDPLKYGSPDMATLNFLDEASGGVQEVNAGIQENSTSNDAASFVSEPDSLTIFGADGYFDMIEQISRERAERRTDPFPSGFQSSLVKE